MHDKSESSKNGLTLTPKLSFVLGIVGAVLIIGTIGFLILLSLFLKGDLGTGQTTTTAPNPSAAGAPSQAPTPSVPSPTRAAGPVKPVDDTDHVRGSEDATVTLIEYSDFECPFCKRFHPTMLQVMDEYEGKVRWVYRHFPLSFHLPLALKQAEAVECADELGGNDAFWQLTDLIFERTRSNGNGMSASDLPKWAAELGLDEGEFQTCLDSGKYAAHADEDMASGSAAGVTGTPGTIIVGADGSEQLVPGAVPYAQLKVMIDAVL